MAVAVNKSETLVVLVVEDELFVRSDIAECLRECGCVVVEEQAPREPSLCAGTARRSMFCLPTSI